MSYFYGGELGHIILDFCEHLTHLHDIQGDARESMRALADKKMKFDLIFIDADKENYSVYYKVKITFNLFHWL